MKKKLSLLVVMLFSITAFAQFSAPPKIAVYVTGDLTESEKRALGAEMLNALLRSGRFTAVERSAAFVAEMERELKTQRSGAIDDAQISKLGKQFGVKYVCIVDAAAAFGSHHVSARIIDVETAEIGLMGKASGHLNSMQALETVSNSVIGSMFGSSSAASASAPVHTASPKMPEEAERLESKKTETENEQRAPSGADIYFAAKWMPLVLPNFYGTLGFNLELGAVWGKGTSLGLMCGLGKNSSGDQYQQAVMFGLNLGSVYELSPQLKLVYGSFFGLSGSYYYYDDYYYDDYYYDDYYYDDYYYDDYDHGNLYYLGPYIGLRLNNRFEFTNKFLIGDGIGYMAALGFHFEGSKRFRR